MSQPSIDLNANLSVSDFTKYLGAGHNVMDGDLRLTETTNGGEKKYDIAKVNYGGSLRRLFFKDARATTSGEENLAVRVALYKAIIKEAGDAVSDDLKAALGLEIVNAGEKLGLSRNTSSKEALSRLTAQHIIEKFTGRQLSAEIRSTGGFDLIMEKYATLGANQDGEDACQDLRFGLYEFIAGNQNKSLDAPELKGLRSDLGVSLRQTEDGGLEIDRAKTKKTGLSEADAKKIAEKYAKDLVLAKVGTNEWKKQWKEKGEGNEIKQSYFRRFDAKNENVVTWRRFGGLKGLGLSKTQFDSLFDRALAVAVKDHAAEASGLKRLVAYYKAIFANKNASIDDLQRFFGDERAYVEWKNKERGGENGEQIKESQFDFNEQAFAKKLWWAFTENPPLPEIDGKAHTLTKGGGLLPQGFMDQLVDYQNRMNTYGDIDDVITIAKTEKTEKVEEDEDNEIAPREKEVRGMIGDLFFNDANPMEMVKYGTSDGERLGRVLFGHQKTFTQICTEIKKAELAAKNGKPLRLENDSYAVIAKKVLSQISSDLAQEFENMIRKINSFMKYERSGDYSVFTLSFSECQNKAQNIFTAVAGFEKYIDDALEKFFTEKESGGHSNKVEDTKAYKQIVKDLKLPAGENSNSSAYLKDDAELLKNILRVNLAVSSGQDQGQGGVRNVALRRMLSAGTRYSNSGLDDSAQFDFGAMLRGGGPALIKRLQSVPADVFADRDLKPNIRSALDDITHNLPGSGDLVLKTQLYGVLNNLKAEEEKQKKQQEGGQDVPVIQEIKVTKSQLGAASIAQTAKCTLVYDKDNENQQNKDVVIKLVRPDVKMAFDKECESFGNFESKKEGDESLKCITKHFISDVGPEFELMKETLNAFVAIVANREGGTLDQAFKAGKTEGEKDPVNLSDVKDRNDLDSQLVKLLGQSNVRKYRTEQLIWKGSPNGEPTKEQLEAAENEIIECLNMYDPKGQGEVKDLKEYYNGLMEIAKKYCVMSPDFIVMKEAPGKPLDEFIADMSKEVKSVINKEEDDPKRKAVMDDLVNAKLAIMQLGEELFNGIAKGVPPAFHGDLHGGNIFYDKDTGSYTLVDYGKGSPLTNDTAKAILNCFATVVKAYDRKPLNPDDTNAKGIDAQIEDRATEVIDAYRSVLQSELAVWKSENPDVEPLPEDIQLIQNTIDELDTNSDKFNKSFYDVLHGDLKDAMEEGNRNPGPVVETLTKTVKNHGRALSNTLFGFFDSYAKLEKNLTKIDDLIHKLDSNKYVTVFVKDELPFGQEDCRATLESSSQENRLEKLGAFYERLPKFIREEADEEVSSSVQEKMRAKWTALQKLKENSPEYQDNKAELELDESSIIKGLGIDSWKEHKSKPLFNFFNQIHLDMQSPETNLVVSPRNGVKVGVEVGGQDKPVEKENWTDDVLQLFYAVEKAKPLESESEDQVNGTEAKITNEKISVSGEEDVFDNGRKVDDMVKKMNNLSLVHLKQSEIDDVKSLAKKNYEAKKKIDKFFQLIIEGFASAPKNDVEALLKEMYLMTGKDENDPDYSNLVKITVGDSGLQNCNKKMTFKTWSPEKDEFYVDYENEAKIEEGKQKGKIYEFVDALKKVYFSDEVFKDEKVMAKMNALVEKYEYSSSSLPLAGARTAVKIFKLVMDESKRRDFLNSQHKTATELSNEEKKYGKDYEVFNTVEKLGEEKEVRNPDTGEMEVKKVNCGKDLVDLEDRCKIALGVIENLNSKIKEEFSVLSGIVNVAVNSLNGGK